MKSKVTEVRWEQPRWHVGFLLMTRSLNWKVQMNSHQEAEKTDHVVEAVKTCYWVFSLAWKRWHTGMQRCARESVPSGLWVNLYLSGKNTVSISENAATGCCTSIYRHHPKSSRFPFGPPWGPRLSQSMTLNLLIRVAVKSAWNLGLYLKIFRRRTELSIARS